MHKNPIGIFDSGVGGLCVLKEIRKQIPDESIHYLADSCNCPYGSKTKDEALHLARKSIEFLLKLDCKLIVIACNTVTAVAIDNFRSEYHIPFIGMEPALKPATLQTITRKIGILATENTFNGRLFKETLEKYAEGMEVFIQPGHGLVELVEQGNQNSKEARILLEEYLLPMLEKGVDTIVLGCTHYPFLTNMIRMIIGDSVSIIDPSSAVAAQTRRVLSQFNLLSDPTHEPCFNFYTTGDKTAVQKHVSDIMNGPFKIHQIKI